MKIDRGTIEAHARERLQEEPGPADPRGRLSHFKRFLKLETDRLRMRHRFGLGGLEIASARSYQVDQVVAHACRLALAEADPEARLALAGCAVVALGGYGRAELSPFSDVDLLFLHQGRAAEGVRRFVEQVLQLLWDVGLTVGHSFRTLAECLEEARGDLHSRTALAEARLVAGDTAVFGALDRALDSAIRRDRKSGEAFLEALRADVAERHARVGGAVCVQEPNVKEGVGGLRDLHAVLWVAQARHGTRGLADAHAAGLLSDREHQAALRAYDFLLRVRAEAHFVDRPQDGRAHPRPAARGRAAASATRTAGASSPRSCSCATTTGAPPTSTVSSAASCAARRRRPPAASSPPSRSAGPPATSRCARAGSAPSRRRSSRPATGCSTSSPPPRPRGCRSPTSSRSRSASASPWWTASCASRRRPPPSSWTSCAGAGGWASPCAPCTRRGSWAASCRSSAG